VAEPIEEEYLPDGTFKKPMEILNLTSQGWLGGLGLWLGLSQITASLERDEQADERDQVADELTCPPTSTGPSSADVGFSRRDGLQERPNLPPTTDLSSLRAATLRHLPVRGR